MLIRHAMTDDWLHRCQLGLDQALSHLDTAKYILEKGEEEPRKGFQPMGLFVVIILESNAVILLNVLVLILFAAVRSSSSSALQMATGAVSKFGLPCNRH